MGQRLNVEIIQGNKPVCNVYMHWSAFTTTSKDVLNNVINEFDKEGINSKSSLKEIVLALMNAIKGARTTPKEEVKLGMVRSTKIEDYHFDAYKDLLDRYPDLLKNVDIDRADYDFFDTAFEVMSTDDYNRFSDWRREVSIDRDEGIISTTEEGMADTRYWEESRIGYNLDDKTVYFGTHLTLDINDNVASNIYKKYNLDFDWRSNITIPQWKEFSNIIQETASGSPYACIINERIVGWIE